MKPEERVLDDLRKSAEEIIKLCTDNISVAGADAVIRETRETLRQSEIKFSAAKNSESEMKLVCDEIRRYTSFNNEKLPEIKKIIQRARN